MVFILHQRQPKLKLAQKRRSAELKTTVMKTYIVEAHMTPVSPPQLGTSAAVR